ncbi:MAG: hypothetical protein QOC98_670 [Frankiaceae bacterium]|nr:hypothetical protein [Frankiaceae bacterium]
MTGRAAPQRQRATPVARAALAVAAVLLTAGACSGTAPSTVSAGGPGVPAAAGVLPGSDSGSASGSGPIVTPAAPTAPAPTPHTTADLRALLLTEADLPAAYSVDTQPSDGGSGISSPSSRCDALAGLINEGSTRGATAEAAVAFDGGISAPHLGEDLALLPSPTSAAAYVTSVRDAAGTCDRLLGSTGIGLLPLSVSPATAPDLGEQRFAMELTARSAQAEIAIDVQLISVGSVVLITTGNDATPEDISAFTSDAYAKLTGGTVPPGGHVSGERRSGGGGSDGGGSDGGGSGGGSTGGSSGGGQPA